MGFMGQNNFVYENIVKTNNQKILSTDCSDFAETKRKIKA
jgi:hypothetical protein